MTVDVYTHPPRFDGQNNMTSIVIIHTVPQNGCSPLYVASEMGHTDVVDILLRSGADVHQTAIKVRIYAVISMFPSPQNPSSSLDVPAWLVANNHCCRNYVTMSSIWHV